MVTAKNLPASAAPLRRFFPPGYERQTDSLSIKNPASPRGLRRRALPDTRGRPDVRLLESSWIFNMIARNAPFVNDFVVFWPRRQRSAPGGGDRDSRPICPGGVCEYAARRELLGDRSRGPLRPWPEEVCPPKPKCLLSLNPGTSVAKEPQRLRSWAELDRLIEQADGDASTSRGAIRKPSELSAGHSPGRQEFAPEPSCTPQPGPPQTEFPKGSMFRKPCEKRCRFHDGRP